MTTQLISTYKQWHGRVAAANTSRDGTGTIVDVVTGHTSYGSRVDRIRAAAEVATTAGMLRLWLYNGTAWRLLDELAVTAITPSTSVEVWQSGDVVFRGGLKIPAGWKLGVTMHNAEAVNVFADGGDYGAAA